MLFYGIKMQESVDQHVKLFYYKYTVQQKFMGAVYCMIRFINIIFVENIFL